MTYLEAIEERVSRRRFTGPVPGPLAQKLQSAVRQANKQSGLGIRYVAEGGALFGGFLQTYGLFGGVHSLFVLAGKRDDINLLEKSGYFGEKLVLEATTLGLGSCWVGGTYDRKHFEHLLKPAEQLVAVIVVGPVGQARGFKENMLHRMLHRKERPVSQMSTADARVPEWFSAGVRAAARAPSARNRHPVHFYYQRGTATAYVSGETEQLVDLGIAKLHFEVAANGRFALGNGAAFVPGGAGAAS